MIPGTGLLLAYVERWGKSGFFSQQNEGREGLHFFTINVSGCKDWKKRKSFMLKDEFIPRTNGYKLSMKELSLDIRRKLLAIKAIRFRNSP